LPKIKSKTSEEGTAITIGPNDLLNFRLSKILPLKAFVYLALRIEGYKSNIETLDVAVFCNRWGLSQAEFFNTIAVLSKKGFVDWDIAGVKIDLSTPTSNPLPDPLSILGEANFAPIVLTVGRVKAMNSYGLLPGRSYLYLYLKIKHGKAPIELDMDRLSFFVGFSKNELIIHLTSLVKNRLISFNFDEFRANTYTPEERIKNLESRMEV
jgi:hypothetical protein